MLRKQGIDVKGKIVLVRYSNPYSYRGFKALTAQKEGAAAILIYSDPAEDGYKKGKVFPDGPWGPESHIQRGAITYDFMVPGDPLTPGWASRARSQTHSQSPRQSRCPKIMALPLSWHDAKPLLENMGGPVAPDDWQGGLPIKYHLGGEQARVHLKIEVDNSIKPYYVVEGRIRGSELPDEWVVLGNHRDAWVFGGVDPSSGTASMMEMTRALGPAAKQGIRPRRTLVVCSWDGEEIGLTGSTEWGEQFADELKKKAVAYINVDSSTSGPNFDGNAVASLAPMLVETSHSLQDPVGQVSLRRVERIADSKAGKKRRMTTGSHRRQSSRHPHRQRLRPYRLPQLCGNARHGTWFRWRLRRLPLDVRRLLLDEPLWGSRLPLSHPDVAIVGSAGAAPGQCRHSALRLRQLRQNIRQFVAECRKAKT